MKNELNKIYQGDSLGLSDGLLSVIEFASVQPLI